MEDGRPLTPTASEQKFEALLESAPDAIVIVDESGSIQIVNGEAERLFGYRRAELIGQPVELLVPERLREMHAGHRRGYMGDPRTRPMGVGLDLVARRRDGSELPVEISLSPLRTGEGLLITAIVRDISDRKRLQEAERRGIETQMQLEAEKLESGLRREVLRRSITAQEEERRRIARELHDETAQALTGVTFGLGQIEAAAELEAAQEEARRLRGEVVATLREVRRTAMRLRPSSLDDLGLVPALEQLVEESPAGAMTEIAFRHSASSRRLDPATELTVYRVVQEALTNAAKHAGADRIEVELEDEDGFLVARVRDDGRGFEPQAVAARGLGMSGMRERAGIVGGELSVESAPGQGTQVVLRVPAPGG